MLYIIIFLLICIIPCTISYSYNNKPLYRLKVATRLFENQAEQDINHEKVNVACPMASKCSGEYRSKGCDGLGKIQGGIATIPFLSWWPIKVYRPCPSYLAAGYQYRREGQTLEQVLFSEPSNKMKERMAAKAREREEKDEEM